MKTHAQMLIWTIIDEVLIRLKKKAHEQKAISLQNVFTI